MKPTYLYIKTHTLTGMKYFGKTVHDPLKYKGSGVVWGRILKKHGDDHTTVVLNEGQPYLTPESISEAAIKFSNDNNITKSREWANIMIEDGLTGGNFTAGYSDDELEQLRKKNKEIANRPEVKAKLEEYRQTDDFKVKRLKNVTAANKILQAKPETKAAIRAGLKKSDEVKIECEYCGQAHAKRFFILWHGENCRENPNNARGVISHAEVVKLVELNGLKKAAEIMNIKYTACKYIYYKSKKRT